MKQLAEGNRKKKIHQTLKVTLAMEARLSDHVWSLEELCSLMPKPTIKASTIGSDLVRKALGESA